MAVLHNVINLLKYTSQVYGNHELESIIITSISISSSSSIIIVVIAYCSYQVYGNAAGTSQ